MTYISSAQRYNVACCDVLSVEHTVSVDQLKGFNYFFVSKFIQDQTLSKYWLKCTKRNCVRVWSRPGKII
jgi:hypothetical protein